MGLLTVTTFVIPNRVWLASSVRSLTNGSAPFPLKVSVLMRSVNAAEQPPIPNKRKNKLKVIIIIIIIIQALKVKKKTANQKRKICTYLSTDGVLSRYRILRQSKTTSPLSGQFSGTNCTVDRGCTDRGVTVLTRDNGDL